MQRPNYPWNIRDVLHGRPNVGALLDLGEENYRSLMRIAPDLCQQQGGFCSSLDNHMDLYLEVLEQTAYTSLIHLTHYFKREDKASPDPDAMLRVYHDASQVEVLELRQSVLPFDQGYSFPALEQKWKINLFLSKWLLFCLRQGHKFTAEDSQVVLVDSSNKQPFVRKESV